MLCPVLFCSIQIISSTNGSGKNPKSIAQTQETTHLGFCTPQFAESQQPEVSPLKHYLNFPFFFCYPFLLFTTFCSPYQLFSFLGHYTQNGFLERRVDEFTSPAEFYLQD